MSHEKKKLFAAFILSEMLIYCDRSVLPGVSSEIRKFIGESLTYDNPDFYFGLLQSVFIFGLIIGAPTFAYLGRHRPIKTVERGLQVWAIALIIGALGGCIRSYWIVLIARAMSGIGEGALVTIVPAWVADFGRTHGKEGMAVSVLLSAIPLGAALGFNLGSVCARFFSSGWISAYVMLAALSTPVIAYLQTAHRHEAATCGEAAPPQQTSDKDAASFWCSIREVLTSAPFAVTVVAFSAFSATVSGIMTFGVSFLVILGVSKKESDGAFLMGLLALTTGVLGTLCGQVLVDCGKSRRLSGSTTVRSVSWVSQTSSTRTLSLLPDDVSGNDNRRQSASAVSQGSADDKLRRFYDLERLHTRMLPVSIVAMLTLCMCSIGSQMSFIVLLFVGFFCLFLLQACLGLAAMWSVSQENRSIANALLVSLLHIMGDVPAPPLFGLLKDYMAPSCIEQGSERQPACLSEEPYVRLTILSIFMWLIWMPVSFLLGMHVTSREMIKTKESQGMSLEDGRLSASDASPGAVADERDL